MLYFSGAVSSYFLLVLPIHWVMMGFWNFLVLLHWKNRFSCQNLMKKWLSNLLFVFLSIPDAGNFTKSVHALISSASALINNALQSLESVALIWIWYIHAKPHQTKEQAPGDLIVNYTPTIEYDTQTTSIPTMDSDTWFLYLVSWIYDLLVSYAINDLHAGQIYVAVSVTVISLLLIPLSFMYTWNSIGTRSRILKHAPDPVIKWIRKLPGSIRRRTLKYHHNYHHNAIRRKDAKPLINSSKELLEYIVTTL